MAAYPYELVYQPDRFSLTVAAADGEPVTLAEAKAQCFVSHSDDDALIARYVSEAVSRVESMTNRALITQTRVLQIDRFPRGKNQVIELPGGNIQSVTSIAYQDADNATQSLGASIYETDLNTMAGTGRIGLAHDQEWPETSERGLPVTITYVAGWPGTGSPLDYTVNVPDAIRAAILRLVADAYRNRGDGDFEAPNATAMKVIQHILAPWVVRTIA